MNASVVIVAYKPHEWLRPCLASVAPQADEIVVVDNGSASDAVRRSAGGVGARYIRLERNRGFPAGVNAGVAAATGDVVALLNDDAFAAPNWLEIAREVLVDPGVAAVQPKLVYASRFAEIVLEDPVHFGPGDERPLGRVVRSVTVDGVETLSALRGGGIHQLEHSTDGPFRWSCPGRAFYVPVPSEAAAVVIDGSPAHPRRFADVINSAGSTLHTDGYVGDIGDGEPDDGQYDEPADRFSLCGAAIAFRREVWDRIGPFPAEFFAYYEDTDWCWRARRAGYQLRYDPRATVRHVGGATTGGPVDPATRLLYQRNRVLCLVRNAPGAVAWPAVREVLAHEDRFETPGLRRALLSHLPRATRARWGRRRPSVAHG